MAASFSLRRLWFRPVWSAGAPHDARRAQYRHFSAKSEYLARFVDARSRARSSSIHFEPAHASKAARQRFAAIRAVTGVAFKIRAAQRQVPPTCQHFKRRACRQRQHALELFLAACDQLAGDAEQLHALAARQLGQFGGREHQQPPGAADAGEAQAVIGGQRQWRQRQRAVRQREQRLAGALARDE